MKEFLTRFCFVVAGCVGLIVIGTIPAGAGTTGGIEGFATDVGLHPIVGVNVTATSPSGHDSTITGNDGFYSINGLPLDTYAVTFFKDGYLTQVISGVTISQDQSMRVNAHLQTGVKTLARVAVRSSTSLVQPTVTANNYVVDQSRLDALQGTPQDQNGYQVLNRLPGIMTDSTGNPTIRAGEQNDIAFTYDGISQVDPIIGGFFNSLSLNGTKSIALSTGGYDVSVGNTNSGVINQVIKRGTHPAQGQATIRIISPMYGHELSFDYGDASPDNRFSYYFGFGGLNDAQLYGDGATILPLQLGNTTFNTNNDEVLNLFYHFGQSGRDELQFLSNLSGATFYSDYLFDPIRAPYASNNGDVQSASDPFGLCNASLAPPYPRCNSAVLQSDYITFFPGQAAHLQNTGAPDTFTFNSIIDKLNFKRQLTPSSFVELRLYRSGQNFVNSQRYHTGSFSDFFANDQTTGFGEAFDYADQLSSQHEVSAGGDAVYFANDAFGAVAPSLEPTLEPLEDLGCPQIAAAITAGTLTPTSSFLSTPGVGGCYIGPFNSALNAAVPGLGLPTDAAHAPMNTYANDFAYITGPLHQYDAWAKDRYQPNQRLTITFGARWDYEVVPIPPDAAAQNSTYYINDSGNFVTVPGRPIGTDVTRPWQISPRLAAAYQLSPRDAIRFSYGKNIEFAPLYGIERPFQVSGYFQNCTIANGCFHRLPGYGTTNFVTNLYQQVILDLTTNLNAQYGNVLPEHATNVDFSYSHDFGNSIEIRLTPYYRKGTNYTISNQPLLFNLRTSGKPVFGPAQQESSGINESTGVELALQRNARFGLAGLLDATYDNTLANYDGDFFPNVNNAAIAAGHFIHVTYVAPLVATLNLAYNARSVWQASATASYQSGYRYGVGKQTFVFVNDAPVQVLNTDLAQSSSQAYYFTNPPNPGTIQHPNIVASRGTPEGADPGTLFTPATVIVSLTIAHGIGAANKAQAGVRVQNLFGNYTPTIIPSNLYYVPLGNGGFGPGSGINTNACAPRQTFGCEPFMHNQSVYPYENEPTGPPRIYTFFLSVKY
jgi:hypothetical protein